MWVAAPECSGAFRELCTEELLDGFHLLVSLLWRCPCSVLNDENVVKVVALVPGRFIASAAAPLTVDYELKLIAARGKALRDAPEARAHLDQRDSFLPAIERSTEVHSLARFGPDEVN